MSEEKNNDREELDTKNLEEMAARTMKMTEEVIEAGEETFYNYLDEWAKKEKLL